MADYTLRFKINAFSPETIPMERLGQYMAELGTMLGEPRSVRFVRLEPGSTSIVHRVEPEAYPNVERHVNQIALGEAGAVHLNAYRALNKRLKEDNADAILERVDAPNGKILDFPGKHTPAEEPPDLVVQGGSVDGTVISLGGKGNFVPVRIQDGETILKCSTSREIARLLGPYIFEDELRLTGEGKWQRSATGEWTLQEFKIQSFDVLDRTPLSEVVSDLRSIGKTGWGEVNDAWSELQKLRNGD